MLMSTYAIVYNDCKLITIEYIYDLAFEYVIVVIKVFF